MKNLKFLFIVALILQFGTAFGSTSLWQRIDDSLNDMIRTLAIDKKGRLWAGGHINGVWFSDDGGKTWQQSGLPDKSVWCLAVDSQGRIWAGGDGAFISIDDGKNWYGHNDFLPTYEGRQGVGNLLVNKNNDVLAVSFHRLYFSQYRSNNEYVPWREAFIPADYAVAVNSKNYIFVGLLGGKLAVSYDDTKSWIIKDPTGNKGPGGYSMVINSKDQIFYSMYHNEGEGRHSSFVYRTDDDGRTYKEIKPFLFGYEISDSGVRLFLAKNDWLFATGNRGEIALSKDDGDTWQKVNDGLLDRAVWSLTSDSLGNVYVGTDSGIYHTKYELLTSIEKSPQFPADFSLQQNFPNPFNSQTVIRYSLTARSPCTLCIYDLSGRKVRRLIEDIEAEGLHEIDWNGLDDHGNPVASGIYILKMKAGTFADYKKMTFIK